MAWQGQRFLPLTQSTNDRTIAAMNPTSDTLQSQFDAAVAASKELTQRPDNATLLKLYGLYKQGSAGDNSSVNPALPIWWAVPSGTPGRRSRAPTPTRPNSATSS